MPYSKGDETKKAIIRAATELFYEQGYRGTTVREISARSGANIGLVKYHFGGKADVALNVYLELRRGFDELVDRSELRPNTTDFFLMSSAIELYLCLESPEYGRFFYEIAAEPVVHGKIVELVGGVIRKYVTSRQPTEHYVALACASLSAIKPALVSYVMTARERVPTEECLLYYLRQQLHFLGEEEDRAETLLSLLRGYYIAAAKGFTPVMVKIRRNG